MHCTYNISIEFEFIWIWICVPFQPDIIQPVRDALDYYTKMQQSLEEEQQKLVESKSSSRKSSQHSIQHGET